MQYLVNLNLNGNELQNAVLQVLAVAPSNPAEGQMYYNSTDKIAYQYKGATKGWQPIGELNIIEQIKVNGTAQTVTNKAVDITVPTDTSDLTNGAGFLTEEDLPEGIQASDTDPLMDGTADAGSANTFARADHVHPSDTSKLDLSGGTMSGNLAMGSNKITGLADGTSNGDAVNFGQLDTKLPKAGGTMSGAIAMGSNKITGLADGENDGDAVNKSQLDAVEAAIPAASSVAGAAAGTAAAGTSADYARADHVHPHDTAKLDVAGGTMSGNIAMGNNKVTGLAAPTADGDAANKKYVDDAIDALPDASDADPEMDGTAAAGSSTDYARADHVHPTDTTRQAKITASGILKGDGNGGVTAAVADTDYGTYSKPSGGIPKTDLASAVQDSLDAADAALPKAGGTMSGAIAMGTNKITGLGDPTADQDAATKKYVDNNFIAASLKGANSGVAELDASGKVPASQLPSYVDDIVEGYLYNGALYEEAAHTTEITGEAGKIYVDLGTNKTYRWSGSAFVEISESLALGETSSTAYRGDLGKEAHDTAAAALPKAGGTMTGAIAMGGNKITGLAAGSSNGDAVRYEQLTGLIKTATGTIGTSATSAEVSYSGTLISARATISGEEVGVDMAIANNKVTFSVTQAPASAVTCTVVYA